VPRADDRYASSIFGVKATSVEQEGWTLMNRAKLRGIALI
jgi:hypothetical protein